MIAALGLLLAPAVTAFGTINSLGQQAEHERITRTALQCPEGRYLDDGSCFEPISMVSFAGGNGTFGAIGAPDGGADALKSEAHCDDADYMDYAKFGLNGTYPHSKESRNQALRDCYEHMKELWDGGVAAAAELLDEHGQLIAKETVLAEEDSGRGVPCVYSGSFSGRAKCDAYEGLGRALHGLQDFYSHSNWVDDSGIIPEARVPPGLGKTDLAPFLSMVSGSGPAADNIPDDFSTGCFNIFGHDTVEGAAACEKDGRLITHVVVNKDKGQIDVQPLVDVAIGGGNGTRLTSVSRTARGNVSDNFERAVRGAVLETRRQWADFRAKLVQTYGEDRSRLMVCALTRDFPARDCVGGRNIALVLSGPGVAAPAEEVRSRAHGTDRVAVFDGGRQYAAFGSNVSLSGLTGEGGLHNGVSLAVDALNGTAKDHIVVIASELDADALVTAIGKAEQKHVRVSLGVYPAAQSRRRRALRFLREARDRILLARSTGQDDNNKVATAVLKTGGTFAVLANEGAKDEFASHVFQWTASAKTRLYRDLTVYDDGARDFTHELGDKQTVNITVTSFNGSALVSLIEDGTERARAEGSKVSLQHTDDDTTVTAHVEKEGLYSIAVSYTSAGIRAGLAALPVVIAGLAYMVV